jgi:peptide chain release factor 1
MFERLPEICRRYDELSAQMADPAIYETPGAYPKLAKEVAHLEPIVKTWRALTSAREELDGARELLADNDPEMTAMAKAEIADLEPRIAGHEEALKLLLLPRDPNDDKNVFLEIRAGTGGDEAGLFAADLFNMYGRYAEAKGWRTEIIDRNETDVGGFKEIVVRVSGDAVFSTLKFESGVHRVQRVPATESQGRIHTSACTVAILPEAEEVELDIPDSDLRIDTFRASGAGGQHVNRTDSAIRITHIPTGLVVSCQDERSQHKNKAKALMVLRARLLEQMEAAQQSERADARKAMVGSGDRSERIRTYNYPQNRVTDHRIGLTLYKLDEVVQGNLDPVVEPLRTHAQQKLLEAQADGAL